MSAFSTTLFPPRPRGQLTTEDDHPIHDIAPDSELKSVSRVEESDAKELEMNQVLIGLGIAAFVVWMLKRA